MDCFSEDEADVTVSSSGSSLAAPLESSSPSCRMMSSVSRLTSTPHLSSQFYSPAPDASGDTAESVNSSPMRSPGDHSIEYPLPTLSNMMKNTGLVGGGSTDDGGIA